MDKNTQNHYILLAKFLHEALGSEYEIILHDFQGDEHSVIYSANNHISGRNLENLKDPRVDETFKFISNQTIQENNYIVSPKGIPFENKVVRSSSFFIKDSNNELIGMLCVNFDGSKYVNLAKQILQLTHMENASIESEKLYTFEFSENKPNYITEITENIVDDTLDLPNIPIDRLNQEEKLDIVSQLNDKGVFMLKGAVNEVAEKLQVSEATLYRYIRIVSKNK